MISLFDFIVLLIVDRPRFNQSVDIIAQRPHTDILIISSKNEC